MGYNRSGTRRSQKQRRQKREANRLALKAAQAEGTAQKPAGAAKGAKSSTSSHG